MKQSQLFTKTQKNISAEEVSKNAQFLIKGGFINKEIAGVYTFLPLGLRVFKKFEEIIREEMNKIGGQELILTTLQNPEVWKKTGRWGDNVIDVWFKTKLKNGRELGLGTTHEEQITNLMKNFILSYKDLPVYAYQFQTKFRNEIRSKSGIMRTREFVMKDLYSFNLDQDSLDKFYEKAADAYDKIFARFGIADKTYKTFASGGSFSKYSHEFQTISSAGEDIIYIDEDKKIAINKEVYGDEIIEELGLDKNKLKKEKSIEVGNIFKLGTKFSEALGLYYRDDKGKEKPVVMGSYGIGPARSIGTVVELFSDEKGIIWPEEVAPFKVHLISLKENEKAEEIYNNFLKNNIEVLYDDRDISPGEKFADADLIGIPYRFVVSKKTLGEDSLELKKRDELDTKLIKINKLIDSLK